MHGFAGWFDLDFCGSTETVHFSTAPECPGTHWYQCRLLFREPLAVNRGQTVTGTDLRCCGIVTGVHVRIGVVVVVRCLRGLLFCESTRISGNVYVDKETPRTVRVACFF
jgi:hypothetical protein